MDGEGNDGNELEHPEDVEGELEQFEFYSWKWEYDKPIYKKADAGGEPKKYDPPKECVLRCWGGCLNRETGETESACVFIKEFYPYVYITIPEKDCGGRTIKWTPAKIEILRNKLVKLLGNYGKKDNDTKKKKKKEDEPATKIEIDVVYKKTMRCYSTKPIRLFQVFFQSASMINLVKCKLRKRKEVQSVLPVKEVTAMGLEEVRGLYAFLTEEREVAVLNSVVSKLAEHNDSNSCVGNFPELNEQCYELQTALNQMKASESKVYYNEHSFPEVWGWPFALEFHEDWIDPLIKFWAITKNSPTGWKRLRGVNLVELQTTSCKHEWECRWDHIVSFQSDEMVAPLICSLDIETVTDRYQMSNTGVSADPDPYRVNDQVWMVGLRFNRFGRPAETESYIFTTHNCRPKKHPDSIVRLFVNKSRLLAEQEMLLAVRDLINERDPDIILGHNILGYDFQYMAKRAGWNDGIKPKSEVEAKARRPGNYLSEYLQLGRLFTDSSRNTRVLCPMIDNNWSSGAYKGMNFTYVEMYGRLILDLYPYMKRSYPSLETYKLGYLAEKYLKDAKGDVEYTEMYRIADRNIAKEVDRVITYLEKDTELPLRLLYKLNIWIDVIEISKVVGISIFELYTRGQGRRGLSQVYRRACKDFVMDLEEIPEITDKDREQLIEGGGVDERTLSGDPAVAEASQPDLADLVPPDAPKPKKKPTGKREKKYEGAYVRDPIPGRYNNVIVLDFKSLYPSIIRSHNIDYTTLVLDPTIPDEDTWVISWRDKITYLQYRFRFIRQNIWRGLVPQALDEFTAARDEARRQLKNHKHPDADKPLEGHESEYAVYDSRQKELKVSSNSVYGLMGSTMGRLGLMPGAMSVTAKGRESICLVMKTLEDHYSATIIYGDTDSAMFNIKGWSYETSYETGANIAKALSDLFPRPMELDFEKIFATFIILGKKMYAGKIYDKTKTKLVYFMKKGLITQRRDYSKFAKDTLETLLDRVTSDECDYMELENYIVSRIRLLLSGTVPIDELKLRKTYNPPYKSTQPHAQLAERMIEDGHDIHPGDIIYYVYVERPFKRASDVRVGLKIQDPVVCRNKGEKLDIPFYIEKQLRTRITALLNIFQPTWSFEFFHNPKATPADYLPGGEEGERYYMGVIKKIEGKYVRVENHTVTLPAEKLMEQLTSTVWHKKCVVAHLDKLFERHGWRRVWRKWWRSGDRVDRYAVSKPYANALRIDYRRERDGQCWICGELIGVPHYDEVPKTDKVAIKEAVKESNSLVGEKYDLAGRTGAQSADDVAIAAMEKHLWASHLALPILHPPWTTYV